MKRQTQNIAILFLAAFSMVIICGSAPAIAWIPDGGAWEQSDGSDDEFDTGPPGGDPDAGMGGDPGPFPDGGDWECFGEGCAEETDPLYKSAPPKGETAENDDASKKSQNEDANKKAVRAIDFKEGTTENLSILSVVAPQDMQKAMVSPMPQPPSRQGKVQGTDKTISRIRAKRNHVITTPLPIPPTSRIGAPITLRTSAMKMRSIAKAPGTLKRIPAGKKLRVKKGLTRVPPRAVPRNK